MSGRRLGLDGPLFRIIASFDLRGTQPETSSNLGVLGRPQKMTFQYRDRINYFKGNLYGEITKTPQITWSRGSYCGWKPFSSLGGRRKGTQRAGRADEDG